LEGGVLNLEGGIALPFSVRLSQFRRLFNLDSASEGLGFNNWNSAVVLARLNKSSGDFNEGCFIPEWSSVETRGPGAMADSCNRVHI